ncbi:MAG TPA: hypothetical protein VHF47_09785 [Acidimicrobiales bacterium]|nr:hypothetical protein [Acidimicrobiales bacterium]
MRRRLAVLLATTLVIATLGMLPSPPPASATMCVGQGTANTGAPFYYPGTPTVTTSPSSVAVNLQVGPAYTSFSFSMTLGTCAPNLAETLSAIGQVSGWCGHAWGSGVTNSGHRVVILIVGNTIVYTGGLAGIGTIMANALAGESCVTGALSFIVVSALILLNCQIHKTKTSSLTFVPGFWTLTTVLSRSFHFGWSGGNYHEWKKVCIGFVLP